MKRKLRYGMVGGGQNAFIGAVHRLAANLDGQTELVAGAFSSDPKNSAATGEQLFLNPRRVYGSYEEMARAEAAALACDLMLVMGSSLVVYPAAAFPLLAKRSGAKLVILNREETEQDPYADLVIHGEIGPVLSQMMGHF